MAITKGVSVLTHNGEDMAINDANIAHEFDQASAYAIGDHVTYCGKLYCFHAPHAANAAWDYTKVREILIGDEVTAVKNNLTVPFDETVSYSAGWYTYYQPDQALYRFTVDHAAGAWNYSHVVRVTVGDEIIRNRTETDTAVNDLKSAISADTEFNYKNADSIEKILSGDDVVYSVPGVFRDGMMRNRAINQAPNQDSISISSLPFKTVKRDVSITVPSGYKALIVMYRADGTYGGYVPSAGYREGTLNLTINADRPYFIIEVRRTDDSALSAAAFDSTSISISFGTLFNPLNDINTAITSLESDIATIDSNTKNAAHKSGLNIWGLRAQYTGESEKVSFPEDFDFAGDIDLYSDGYKFICLTDLSTRKNVSGAVHEVDPSTIVSVLSSANAGDTLLLADGSYPPISVGKSINIVAKNKGEVVFAPIALTDFSTSGISNVYSFAKTTTPTSAYDISRIADGIIRELTVVGDTSDLSTPGTCYFGSRIYVHMFDDSVPSYKTLLLDNTALSAVINCQLPSGALVYIDGCKICGGKCNVIAADTDSASASIVMIDCDMNRANTFDSIDLTGCNGFFQRCTAAYAQRDGFNYHKSSHDSSLKSCGVEIDCVGHDNGSRASASQGSNNGSTMHDGGKIVRINGAYYNNYGGNVADISTQTLSYNYGCLAFDSKAIADNERGDFWTDTGCHMYLYGCKAIGDISKYNLYCKSGAITAENTEYETKYGSVVDA